MKKTNDIDTYIARFPADVQLSLEKLRATIIKTAPAASEVISYNMPAFKLNGMLVYYAAYERHIGFYPTPGAIKFYTDELAEYKTSKGAIQFPLDKPLPVGLITKIVKFRVKENQLKWESKNKK